MNPELLLFHEQVTKCTRPEELFGVLKTETELKTRFRKFAMIAHVDRYQRTDEKRIAHIAFTKLNEFHKQAQDKIVAGLYGTEKDPPKKNSTPAILKSKKGTYVVTSVLAGGDLSAVYLGEFDKEIVVIKVSNHSISNLLLFSEAKLLIHINKVAINTVSYKKFIPHLHDNFTASIAPSNEIRQINILGYQPGFYSLQDIFSQYPEGVDQRHFVWMFNRLLTVLSFVHSLGAVHGSVLPQHVLFHPETHAIYLLDWCFSVPKNTRMIAIPSQYRSWYPTEVTSKQSVSSATDIYMAALCMSYILGADFGDFSHTKICVHSKFRRFLEESSASATECMGALQRISGVTERSAW